MANNHITVLFIDDDPGDAKILRRALEKIPDLQIDFIHRSTPEEGFEELSNEDVDLTFLDYQLGATTGLELLSRIRATKYVRPVIMLTGHAEREVAVELMRAGADDYIAKENIKPDVLQRSMRHAQECYLRRKAENEQHDLLAKTLTGSIRMLMDILELLQPTWSGRAMRAAQIVKDICGKIMLENTWEMEIAALLCQVGCVQVPANILAKADKGGRLSPEEASKFWKHPQVASDLIRRIPRMEGVADTVAYQDKCFNGKGHPGDDRRGEEIPLGARMLKLALDFDQIVTRGESNHEAMKTIQSRKGFYDPTLVEALTNTLSSGTEYEIRSLSVDQLEPNMVFDEHVLSTGGSILIPKGKSVTATMCNRLQMYATMDGNTDEVCEPIRMRVPVYRSQVARQRKDHGALVYSPSGSDANGE